MGQMLWERSHRADLRSRLLADRHYNRQKPGTPQFVPPGRCLVLYAGTPTGEAFWVTSWPFAEYVKHAWAGAWVCSAFRNEGAGTASGLIRSAVAASRAEFGEPPALGMITFIDRKKVIPIRVRGQETWGYSYKKAGFRECGETKGGLLALQLLPGRYARRGNLSFVSTRTGGRLMFLDRLFRKPSQPVRFIVATARENKEAQTRRIHTELQLAVAIAQLTPEQKAEAIKRAATVKFETPEQRFKRMEPDMFRGMRYSPLKVGKA